MADHGKLCDQCFEICTFDFCLYCDVKTLQCAFCLVNFKSLKTFIDHIDVNHSEIIIKELRPRTPRPKGLLYCEITMKQKKEKFNLYFCPSCKLAYQTAKKLLIHTARIHNQNEFECAYCGKKFQNKTTIRKHISFSHSNGEQFFVCDICKKNFTKYFILKAHILHHMSSGSYECSLCDKIFKHPFSLKRHVKQHSIEKCYTCNDCGKSFPFNFSLVRHKKVHNTREEFACNFCPKKYKWRTDFEKHIKTHSNEEQKSYKCGTCSKVFDRKFSFIQHQQKHSEGKLHLCQCGRSYKYQSSLSRHNRICHKLNTFEFISVKSGSPSL